MKKDTLLHIDDILKDNHFIIHFLIKDNFDSSIKILLFINKRNVKAAF
jgi:hypothetical protein